MSTANKKSPADLQLAFDVGHSPIGWAILSARESKTDATLPSVFKAGVVLFPVDDCLASIRRLYRSQRRHIRSTRERIKKLARLFRLMGVFSENDEKMRLHPPRKGSPLAHPAPWLRAAQVLVATDEGELKRVRLSWGELFDVLRWYAHNRGYDAHVPWARQSEGTQSDQAKRTEAFGIVFDLIPPDVINITEKLTKKMTEGNAPVRALLKDGLKLIQCGLSGVDILTRSLLCGIAQKPTED